MHTNQRRFIIIIKTGESIIGPYEVHHQMYQGQKRYFLYIRGEIYEDFFAPDSGEAIGHVENIMEKVVKLQMKH